jgi:D-3-phosphoglycerate dehydrogenase
MTRRLHVLFTPHPSPNIQEPWNGMTTGAIKKNHELRILDRSKPLEPQFEGIEAVVDFGGQMTDEEIDCANKSGAKFLQVQTTGLDHVNVSKILETGMLFANCPGEFSSTALAQSAMMFILNMANQYVVARQNFGKSHWYCPVSTEIEGKTLGIVGFGASGQDLARRAKPFGMRVMAIDVRPIEQDILDEIQPDFLGSPDDLDRVVAESDFLSLHLHLNDETRHTIDTRRIGLMKTTACLVNVSRGPLVDEQALHEALLEGRIGGAAIDVFEQEPPDTTLPVYQLPNVYVTPHTAGSSDGTARKRAQHIADNLDRYARGEALVGQIS